jgi:hypothetical protein
MTLTWPGWRPIGLCALISSAAVGLDRLDPFPEDRLQVQASPATLPSTRVAPTRAIAEGTPLMSLVVDRDSLHDPVRGLLTHPQASGREWERPGYVSYFDGGSLKLATKAGVRLHGGDSRVHSKVKSYRLYFRPSYGVPALPSSTFFDDRPSGIVTRVIAHNDVRRNPDRSEWHLVNPLAYDIAERLGGIVPRTQPVRFYLNGEPQGLYVLTEHITPEFLEARFGHRNFTIQSDPGGESTRLFVWAARTRPFTMETAAQVVDIDNLTSWALTILFCATTDVLSQSPMIRDQSEPDARWFWVMWDLDHSFMDRYSVAPQPWLLDSYHTLLNKREARSRILTRLLRGDAGYRRYFARRLAVALNHQLSRPFLDERYSHYVEVALRNGISDNYLKLLSEFLRERPRALWNLSAKYLKTGPPATVTVAGPETATVVIDGFATQLPYTGTYLPGTSFALEARGAPGIGGWRVNGEPVGEAVSLQVTGNLTIEAITPRN